MARGEARLDFTWLWMMASSGKTRTSALFRVSTHLWSASNKVGVKVRLRFCLAFLRRLYAVDGRFSLLAWRDSL